MSKLEVDAIEPQSGTTLTLGASGDSVTFASGANLSVDGTIKLDGNYPVGTNNVALGNNALDDPTLTGGFNTAIGGASMSNNTTGANQTAVGFQSLLCNSTGCANVAIGAYAMQQNTSGLDNTALGAVALQYNTTGGQNTAIGRYALEQNTTANNNTAVGFKALQANTTGYQNTAVGLCSLVSNTTGPDNVAVGWCALASNISGCENTTVGSFALKANTTGCYNVAIGRRSLQSNTSASENTAVGYSSLCANTTGTGNTAVGMNAALNITTGVQNTAIGSNAKPLNVGGTGEIVLGFDVTGVGNNHFTFGNSNGANRVYNNYTANASWTRVSDERLKNNITDANLGLDFISKVRPVTFNWKPSNEIDPSLEGYHKETNENNLEATMHGFVAQEVKQALLDSGVAETDLDKYGLWSKEQQSGVQAVSREMFIMPLINAIKELKAEIDLLKNK